MTPEQYNQATPIMEEITMLKDIRNIKQITFLRGGDNIEIEITNDMIIGDCVLLMDNYIEQLNQQLKEIKL